MAEISSITTGSEGEIARRAGEMVEEILDQYSDFQVRTIDSFMSTVFRASAVELGAAAGFPRSCWTLPRSWNTPSTSSFATRARETGPRRYFPSLPVVMLLISAMRVRSRKYNDLSQSRTFSLISREALFEKVIAGSWKGRVRDQRGKEELDVPLGQRSGLARAGRGPEHRDAGKLEGAVRLEDAHGALLQRASQGRVSRSTLPGPGPDDGRSRSPHLQPSLQDGGQGDSGRRLHPRSSFSPR